MITGVKIMLKIIQICKVIRKEAQVNPNLFPIKEINAGLTKARLPSLKLTSSQLEAIPNTQYSESHAFSLLALISPNQAVNKDLEIDHIFPQKPLSSNEILMQEGLSADEMREKVIDNRDCLFNLQLLPKAVNNKKSDSWPKEWAKEWKHN